MGQKERIRRYRRKAQEEGRKLLSGVILSERASAILEAERERSGRSVARILNRALVSYATRSQDKPQSMSQGALDNVIRQLRLGEGRSPREIAEHLTKEKILSPNGREWDTSGIIEIIRRLGI